MKIAAILCSSALILVNVKTVHAGIFDIGWLIALFTLPGIASIGSDVGCRSPSSHCGVSTGSGNTTAISDDKLPPGVPKYNYDLCKGQITGKRVTATHPNGASKSQ